MLIRIETNWKQKLLKLEYNKNVIFISYKDTLGYSMQLLKLYLILNTKSNIKWYRFYKRFNFGWENVN